MSGGTTPRFDLIVVGLGAMGAAVAYQAARRGLRVLGIDRFEPPHTFGSTHAETRVSRLAVGEGEQYLPFVRRSHEIWRELEEASGETLLHECGGLIVTQPVPSAGQRWFDFVSETSRIAEGAEVRFDLLDAEAAAELVPGFTGFADRRIGYEPTGALVMAERALAVQLTQASEHGAELRTGERVVAVAPLALGANGDAGVEVTTDQGDRYRADRVVVATGPWAAELADPGDAAQLSVTRQVVYWFEIDNPEPYGASRCPWVMWVGETNDDYFCLFPIPPGSTPALKVLTEQFSATTDPESVERTVSQAEIHAFHQRHVARHLPGVSDRCVKAEVCLYTSTPDEHFLIDTSPRSDRILLMSPCSGHGFKHSAALGEAVAELAAEGRSTLDLAPFSRRRFGSP